jgi:hypothetical protein
MDIPEEVAAFVDELVHKAPIRCPDRVAIAVDEVLQTPGAAPDRSPCGVHEQARAPGLAAPRVMPGR